MPKINVYRTDMTKKQMKQALIKRMKTELKGLELLDALALLDQFEKVFEIKKYAEKAKGFKKYYYYVIGYTAAVDGYIRDIRVNSTVGKKLFSEHYKFGTLTATLGRVKQDYKDYWIYTSMDTLDNLEDDSYNFKLAHQICAVLSNYDKGHC